MAEILRDKDGALIRSGDLLMSAVPGVASANKYLGLRGWYGSQRHAFEWVGCPIATHSYFTADERRPKVLALMTKLRPELRDAA